MPFLINFIGAGQLGKTLGYLLVKNGVARIGAICNASDESALKAVKFIGDGTVFTTIKQLPPADIIFITTPDTIIPIACKQLSENTLLKKNSIVVHCSGALTSDSLQAIRDIGCFAASVHPIHSFASASLSIHTYQGTYCAVEGDSAALSILTRLFDAIGSKPFTLEKEKKPLYHAAGVFASNYLITLAQQALSCLSQAGIDKGIAMSIITDLMQKTVNNLTITSSPRDALTGPIKRGDAATVQKHLAALTTRLQKEIYTALGKATLSIAPLDTGKEEEISSILKKRN